MKGHITNLTLGFLALQIPSLTIQSYIMAPRLNIIILILGEDPNYGYYATGPMYDVAFRHVDQMYPGLFANTTRHVLYQRNVVECSSAAANMVELVGKVMDLVDHFNGPTVLFSPGCSLEVIPLADFARELNLLLLASTSSDVAFTDKQRFPTFVSFCPTGKGGSVPGLNLFLEKYSWSTISIFCEVLSNYLNVASVFGLHCRAMTSLLMAPASGFTVFYQEFDSVRNAGGSDIFRYLLLRAQLQSRIIIVESRQDVVRRFMIQAHLLNMTSGHYVFLYPEPNEIPSYISPLNKTDDPSDHLAEEAYRALILLRLDPWRTTNTDRIFQEVALRSSTHFNYTYRLDEMINDDSLAVYEAVSAFAMIFSETASFNKTFSTQDFRRSLLNRTFVTSARNVTIGADAYRQVVTLFCRFNETLQDFTTGWVYKPPEHIIEVVSEDVTNSWPGGRDPPPNVPPCGFQGRSCTERKKFKVLGSLICLVAISVIIGVVIYWKIQRPRREEMVWLLECSHLSYSSVILLNASRVQSLTVVAQWLDDL